MNLPRDWTKKKDWLEKANEPSHLSTRDHMGIWWMVLVALVAVGCGVLFFGRLIF